MIVCESASDVSGPKFIVPKHSRLTDRPVRPRWVNCTGSSSHLERGGRFPPCHWVTVFAMMRSIRGSSRWMARAVAAAGAMLVIVLGSTGPVYAHQAKPEIAFRLTDPRIIESSGLA